MQVIASPDAFLLLRLARTSGLEKKIKKENTIHDETDFAVRIDNECQSGFRATLNFPKIWGGSESASTIFLHLPTTQIL